MKKITMLLCLAMLAGQVLFAQDLQVPVETVKQFAGSRAAVIWGDVYPDEPIPIYSLQNELIAWSVNYSIGKPFPARESLMELCDQEGQGSGNAGRWLTGQYGSMLVSATKATAPLVRFSQVISDEYAYGKEIEKLAREKFSGRNCELYRIYLMNELAKWYCYRSGNEKVYVKIFPPVEVYTEAEFNTAVQTRYNKEGLWRLPPDVLNGWEDYLQGMPFGPLVDHLIPNEADYVPFYDWSFGCTPTAFSMALAYWDNSGMTSGNDYGNLVKYHLQRYDHVQGDTDKNVPDLQRALAIAMSTDSMTGSTGPCCWLSGFINETDARGYGFSGADLYGTSAQYLAWAQTEINAGRPFHFGTPGHSSTGVGYDDANYIIRHNTWGPAHDKVIYTQCDLVGTIVPGGQYGAAVNLTKPIGDPRYSDNATGANQGEDLYAGDAFEITWDYDYLASSWVRLSYSVNAGTPFTIITSNTPNDGLYDWRIPSGIGSNTLGRIKVEVLDASGVEASDGSYGNFEFHAGGSLYDLTPDSYISTSTVPDYYQFTSSPAYWSVVGIRPNTDGEDWDIQLFDNTSFSNSLAISTWGGSAVDFIVIDGNHTASAARGVKAIRYSGTGTGRVEWEGDNEIIYAGSTGYNYTWSTGDVVEMYDVWLNPGYYKCTMLNSGSADLGMALYASSGAAYYSARSGYTALADANAAGGDESFWITITTADYYGLCVFANNTSSSTFTIKFETQGQWLGTVSNDWFDPGNWSAAFVPDATIDVTINTGYTYHPIIGAGNGYCKNITIGAGAKLSLGNADLDVAGNMTIYGQLEMTNINADYYVTGNVYWESGSTANITANGEFRVSGDWEFRPGANAVLANSTAIFTGTSAAFIRSYEANCALYNVECNKSGGWLSNSNISTDTLKINGYLATMSATSIFYSQSSYPLVLKGPLTNYGHIYCGAGTFIFDNYTPSIDLNTGDYFNNIIISTSGNVTLADSLRIYGNLEINSGALVTANFPVLIKGDWTNNVGSGGFSEGTGKVVFNGGNYHQVCSNETFYILEVDKPLGGAFRTGNNAVTCSHYDWTAGAVDVAAGSFTANNLLDNGLYGSYYVNTGGTINLSNTDDFIDLHGYLYIYGGTINVWGGYGWDSYWPYFADAGLTMTAGVLDIKDYGVLLYNGGYTFTENITGGTIRTATSFRVERADFTMDAGTIEFNGTADGYFHTINGGYVKNVTINKGAFKDDGPALTEKIIRNRETGEVTYAPLASTVIIDNTADVNGNVVIQSGVLSAGSNMMYVEGNWNNIAGTAGFNEGTGTVEFNGATAGDILTAETFYNLNLNKTYANYNGLELWQDVAVTNDLHIIDGTMELNSPANLAISGHLTIDLNAGLNADDMYAPQISIGKNWTNSNTTSTITAGFYPGSYSRVIFNGAADQYLTTSCTSEAFNYLTIDKPGVKFRPNNNIQCNNNMLINNGIWEDNVVSLHHVFYKDFYVGASGAFYNAAPNNTVEFTGSLNSILTYQGAAGTFHNLLINKSIGYGVTQVGNTSCQYTGLLTIENGLYSLNGYTLLVTGDINVNDAGTLNLPAGSKLVLTDTRSLNINSGGRLDIDGTSGNQATIYANVGAARYNFYVYSGGTISADYCVFKNMTTYGVCVLWGGIVDPAHAFRGCTFQDGSLVLLLIDNDQLLTIRNAVFPTNTWGGSYNVAKTVASGHLYFVDFTGAFSGEDYDYDPNNLVDWVPTLTATATAAPGTICAGSSSQLNVNQSGGLAPFTYLWSPSTGLSNPNIINPVATPANSITYNVTVTDALGSTKSSSVGVTVLPNLTVGVSIVASANPSPPGNWVTFTATPQNGGSSPSYQWYKNDIPVGTGLPTYSDNTLAYGNRIKCVMTSNYLCPLGNPATSNTITMIIVATDATAFGTISSGTTVCIDASNRITVAGPSGPFHIESGGRADLIAGNSIQYLYGTDVDPGGYMHGWITTANEYCGSLSKSMVSAVGGVETDEVATSFSGSSSQKFVIYPNPSTGSFTLMNKGDDLSGKVTVAMFDMRGAGIFSAFYEGERSHQFNLNSLAPGIYFLKVATNNQIESFKLIVTR